MKIQKHDCHTIFHEKKTWYILSLEHEPGHPEFLIWDQFKVFVGSVTLYENPIDSEPYAFWKDWAGSYGWLKEDVLDLVKELLPG